ILPGEKERTCSVLLSIGQPHSMERSEIIWLFIDMYHLWSYLAHNFAQLRIEVQVKVAVECHRRHNHLVALRIETLQHLLTAIVTSPVCRSNQCQFDIGAFRQFFQFALRSTCNESF